MDKKDFVVGADGHDLSDTELEEARRHDPPVSTGGAPDTRRQTTTAIEIDRAQVQIRKFDKRIDDILAGRAKATAAGRNLVPENMDPDLLELRAKRRALELKIARLEKELHKH